MCGCEERVCVKARVKGEGVNEQSVLVPHLSARHPSWECAAAPRVADSISKEGKSHSSERSKDVEV